MNDVPPPLHSAPAPSHPVEQAPPPRRSGCGWGIGCGLGCLLAVVACVVIAAVAVIGAMKWVESTVNTYAAPAAVPLAAPVASPAQVEAATEKLNAFAVGMNEGGQPVPLRLTGEELNLLLWNHPAFEAVAGKANVAIEGDSLRSQMSINLNDLNLPEGFASDLLKDKYFNGDVTLKLAMSAGTPSLYLGNLSVNGTPVPELFMGEIRKLNLLDEVTKNPDATKLFERIEEIRIENGELIVVPTPAKAAP